MNSIFKRLRCWINVLYYFFVSFGGSKARILTSEETVDMIVKSGKSLIRFGDGEFGIFNGRSISYQDCSQKLIDEFKNIKKDYEEQKDCNYIVAVPKRFFEVKGFKLLWKRKYIASWSQARADFLKYFNQSIVYGDAFLFKKTNNNIFGRIWEEDKNRNNIIFIHNNSIYADYFKNKYKKNVYFIKCPNRNAYEVIEDIIDQIKNAIDNNGFDKSNLGIVISCGPAGKVLVRHFSNMGFLCVDTGHCWDEPLVGLE